MAEDSCQLVAMPEEPKSDASRCLRLEIGLAALRAAALRS
jgi:hypothetical protein